MPGGRASLSRNTISGSIFGATSGAIGSVASLLGACRTVSSYMSAQTSVSSFSARHTALLA